MSAPLLEFRGIEKSFFGVKVLKGVSFSVPAGGVTGLVGENGAGKSTLMNILGGNLQPEAGILRFDGMEYTPKSSRDAVARGIAFIHQELNLFPNLTVAENIFLTRFPRVKSTPFIRGAETERQAAGLLCEVGLEISPRTLVQNLSAGERQLVEIAKALSSEARLIILDEPTTSLSERETKRLFALIKRLRSRGRTMIYISHNLPDVFRVCADIVVLREGEVVGAGSVDSFDAARLISLMVGRPINRLFPERHDPAADRFTDPILEVRGLTRAGVVEDISFRIHRGEVVGLAGLMGAGRTELARILFGLDPRSHGGVFLAGESLGRLSPRGLIKRGVAFLTEDRRAEGLCPGATVADNLTLVTTPRHGRTPLRWLCGSALQTAVTRIRRVVKLDAKVTDGQPVRTLSGGNQQKIVLGKWLLAEPRLLILDEPTRGIDVGAKFEIYRLIHQLADNGAGLLVISSELDELIGLCDRILVMRTGKLVADLPRAEFERERILRAALGSVEAPGA